MAATPQTPLTQAQTFAQSAHIFIVVAVGILALTGLADVIAPIVRAAPGEVVRDGAAGLASAAPLFLFALALWSLNRALGEYKGGVFFSLRSARAILHAGLWADAAMIMKVLVTPTILGALVHEPGLHVDFERADFGVMALAMGLTFMGRVLEGAAALKAENDQIV